MGGDAKDVLVGQFAMAEVDSDGDYPEISEQGSWPQVVNELSRRFITEEILRKAYDAVARAEQ